MKVVILAGGRGTRLEEETQVKAKPMVEIGERPILWHIMKHYEHYGLNDIYVALGYKGESIKRFFLDYRTMVCNMRIRPGRGQAEAFDGSLEDWTVNLIDTGLTTNTGGRVKRLQPWIGQETFMLTYGDGVSTVDLKALLALHRKAGRIATVTAVRPPARFGRLDFDGDLVSAFAEKPQTGEGWISGGFFVFEPAIFDYIGGDDVSLELQVLTDIARAGQLAAYQHEGFWQCMDTLRDKNYLEALWQGGGAPWRIWD